MSQREMSNHFSTLLYSMSETETRTMGNLEYLMTHLPGCFFFPVKISSTLGIHIRGFIEAIVFCLLSIVIIFISNLNMITTVLKYINCYVHSHCCVIHLQNISHLPINQLTISHPTLRPRQPPFYLLSVSEFDCSQQSNICETMQYFYFCSWYVSLNLISSSPSIQQVSTFHSSLRPNIPLYVYNKLCLFIYLWVNIWADSSFYYYIQCCYRCRCTTVSLRFCFQFC